MVNIKNISLKYRAVVISTLLLLGFSSQSSATPIISSATGLVSPDVVIDFEGLASGVAITNQYSAQGVNFVGAFIAQSSCVATITSACSNSSNGSLSSVYSFQFTNNVSEAALELITNPGNTTFSAFLGGILVESFIAATNRDGVVDDYYGFTGIVFDEIKYTISAQNSNFNLDNLQFSTAVPEPSILALFGLGLLGLGFARRRKA